MAWYIWLLFCRKKLWDLAFENYQNKKKTVAELGPSDLLPVYESNFAEMPISPLLKTAKNIKQKYFMNYHIGVKVCFHYALNVKAQCRCYVAFRGILVMFYLYVEYDEIHFSSFELCVTMTLGKRALLLI